jgi:hypothetical protein
MGGSFCEYNTVSKLKKYMPKCLPRITLVNHLPSLLLLLVVFYCIFSFWGSGGLVVSFNNYYSKTRLVATLHDYVKSNLKTILFVYLWLFEITVCKL